MIESYISKFLTFFYFTIIVQTQHFKYIYFKSYGMFESYCWSSDFRRKDLGPINYVKLISNQEIYFW